MEKQSIINFKKEISNLSLQELNNKLADCRDAIAKMIMDSDLVMKIAILEAAIKEKKD